MSHVTRAVRASLTASVVAASLAGCLAAELSLDEADELDGFEDLGESSFALCSDGSADAQVTFFDQGGQSAATSAQTSDHYDHPACADRFTVELTNTGSATQPMSIVAGWGESLPATESACPLAFANVQVHEYTVINWNCSGTLCMPVYGWREVGDEALLRGQWISFFGGGFCQLVFEDPMPDLQPSWFRSRVRVSVRAYAWAIFFPAYKRAQAGLYSMPPIY